MVKKEKNIKIEYEPVARVKLDKMKKMIKSIEKDYSGTPEIIDNMDITFEYIISSLFSDIMDNINKEFANQYITGFNDRLDIKKVSMIEQLNNKNILNYVLDDLDITINNINVLIRKNNTTDNDKKALKQICEVLEILKININKLKEQ